MLQPRFIQELQTVRLLPNLIDDVQQLTCATSSNITRTECSLLEYYKMEWLHSHWQENITRIVRPVQEVQVYNSICVSMLASDQEPLMQHSLVMSEQKLQKLQQLNVQAREDMLQTHTHKKGL